MGGISRMLKARTRLSSPYRSLQPAADLSPQRLNFPGGRTIRLDFLNSKALRKGRGKTASDCYLPRPWRHPQTHQCPLAPITAGACAVPRAGLALD